MGENEFRILLRAERGGYNKSQGCHTDTKGKGVIRRIKGKGTKRIGGQILKREGEIKGL